MAPTRRPLTQFPTRMIPDRAQPAQPSKSSIDNETQEPSPYRPTFIGNDELQIQLTNNAVVYNGSEWQNLLAGDQSLPEIPGFAYDHNVPHEIPRILVLRSIIIMITMMIQRHNRQKC